MNNSNVENLNQEPEALDGIPRSNPIVPLEMSAKALSDPKLKCSGRYRRSLMRSRERIVLRPTTPATPVAVKMFRRLQGLTLHQLNRRQHQFARRASTAKHLLDKLDNESSFRPPLEASQRANLHFLDQATAEVKVRLNPALKKPAAQVEAEAVTV